jgi:hypothetical protein
MMLQAAPATGAAPAAGRPTTTKQAARPQAESDRDDAAEAAPAKPEPMTPEQKRDLAVRTKLAEVLRGLEKKLDADGDYAKGSVIVKDGKVEVAIYLREMSDEAVRKLTDLGFQKILDAPAAKMVLGSIQVSKLADAAMLDVVRLIDVPKLAD